MMWKDIKGFENKYQLSLQGKVKSLNYNNTGKSKILKSKINRHNGLLEVTLNKNDKHYYKTISRLMIETYTNIQLNRNDIIMYKDNDKTNCAFDNLYIITRGKRQELTYDLDHRYKPKYEYYGKILSTKQISKINKIDSKTIRSRIKKLYWNIYEAAEIPKGSIKLERKCNNEDRI